MRRRDATPSDLPVIADLIRALADWGAPGPGLDPLPLDEEGLTRLSGPTRSAR